LDGFTGNRLSTGWNFPSRRLLSKNRPWTHLPVGVRDSRRAPTSGVDVGRGDLEPFALTTGEISRRNPLKTFRTSTFTIW
jgi:hypothetical protein